MSHHGLQRALVVALHDPDFLRDPGGLAGFDLTDGERAQLLAVDRRALATDPLRRRRILRVLCEELRASTTLALAETRSLAFAERFFASPAFRRAVAERSALVPAYADYLGAAGLTTPQLVDVLRLEATAARARRDRDRAAHPGVALAAGVAVAALDASALPTVQVVESYLFELSLMPQVALCDDRPPLPPLPPLGQGTTWLLWSPAASGVTLTEIDQGLYRALDALATPRPRREAAAAVAAATGVPAARAADLVQSLWEEGLLAEGPPSGAPLLANLDQGGRP